MIARETFARYSLTFLSLVGMLAIVGCSDDGLPRRYSVSGTVTYKGQPLPKGKITLMPNDPAGRGGFGEIKDGSYTITTQNPGDGAFPGEYTVLITDLEIDMSAAEAASKKSAEKAKVEASQIDQAAVANALKSAKSTIPEKYGRVMSSGLKAKVEEKSNTFTYDLVD